MWPGSLVRLDLTGESWNERNRVTDWPNTGQPFKAGKEKGYDDFNAHLYAAAQARDLMDFAKAGNRARELNQVIVFLNAAIQGSKRNVEALRENPTRYLTRFRPVCPDAHHHSPAHHSPARG